MDWRTYLNGVRLMQLSTCRDNQPWLCNVWFVQDEETDKIYFISRSSRRHCEELADNPRVACTFHKHYTEGLGQAGQALVIAGVAGRVADEKTIERAYKLYAAQHPKLPDFQKLESFMNGTGDHFFYEITPMEIVVWDDVTYPGQSRRSVAP